jgi:hypothetical protein
MFGEPMNLTATDFMISPHLMEIRFDRDLDLTKPRMQPAW